MPELMKVEEVAKLLRTTPESLRTLMSAGSKNLPPSFLIGRRRVFLRRSVLDWLYQKAGVPDHGARPTDTRGSLSTKENPMAAALNEISEGDVFLDEDDEEEFTVKKVYPQSGYAVLEDSEENEKTVTLKSLLDAIESGDLVRQDDDGDAKVD